MTSPPVDPKVRPFHVALMGNPNTGKTTLFNRLCGVRAKTANFPGTTTSARVGSCESGSNKRWKVTDLPGTYRLSLDLPEAAVCREALDGELDGQTPDAVVAVVDACNLPRHLALVGELRQKGLPLVVALNMVDLARRRGLSLDVDKLSTALGCPVIPVVARKGEGIEEVKAALATLQSEISSGGEAVAAPLDLSADGALNVWVDDVVNAGLSGLGDEQDSLTERLDLAFTHPLLGLLVFAGIMGGLFWTVFSLASVPMDLIDLIFAQVGGAVASVMPEGAIRDLLVDGVIAGLGGTVIFLPQICLLFFLISLLEDTGYLARAAFVMDRLLSRFGLPGHAFVPLLSSHACALPGIMSTRLIPDFKDRLATILVAPFMSCSARLPVYVLLTGLLFPNDALRASMAFAACYLLGALAALGSALIFRRSWLKGRSRPMVLELPTYKWPSVHSAVLNAFHQGRLFLEKAGTVIVGICIVMWWLSAYPQVDPPKDVVDLRTAAEAAAVVDADGAELMAAEADRMEAQHASAHSFAGRLGRTLEPAFAPLGFDWQITVGVLTSFLAREVFVATMAVLVTGDDEERESIVSEIATATRDDGSPLFDPATAASLLVFFVLAMQCLPTLAVTRQETGSRRWALVQLLYMSGLAWVCALITYHGMHMLGLG